jgi:hypothetical protein
MEWLSGSEKYDKMSTYPIGMTKQGMLPVSTALTARDFKVCEECGGPAMIHPRLELGASDGLCGGSRKILCCSCLHQAATKGRSRALMYFRIGDQIWQCRLCGTERAWGLLEPADRELVPALPCARCQASTRHRYHRVA